MELFAETNPQNVSINETKKCSSVWQTYPFRQYEFPLLNIFKPIEKGNKSNLSIKCYSSKKQVSSRTVKVILKSRIKKNFFNRLKNLYLEYD
jgi:hypothetical protein